MITVFTPRPTEVPRCERSGLGCIGPGFVRASTSCSFGVEDIDLFEEKRPVRRPGRYRSVFPATQLDQAQLLANRSFYSVRNAALFAVVSRYRRRVGIAHVLLLLLRSALLTLFSKIDISPRRTRVEALRESGRYSQVVLSQPRAPSARE